MVRCSSELDTFLLVSFIVVIVSLQILCQNVSCPYPEKPPHGFVNVHDDVAQYSCQLSYYLLGSNIRTCSSKFSWTESAPLCAADVAAGMPTFISSGVSGSDAFLATDILPADQRTQQLAPIQNDVTCAQTDWEPAPWLIVDLLNPCLVDGYNISKLGYIDTQNRHNESQSLEILVGNSTSDMRLNSVCAQYDNIPAESGLYLSGFCIKEAAGRYVVVRSISNNPSNHIKLGLCKVVVLSSTVLTSAHCPSPAYHRIFRSKCYDIRNNEEMPWVQADQYCKEHNGRLALVESQVDHDFLAWDIGRNNLRRPNALSQVNLYWLAYRKNSKDQWISSDGKPTVFEAWANNASTKPYGETNLCASVDSQRPSQWLKTNCDNFAGWICEYSVAFCGIPATPEGVVGYIPAKRFYSIWENVTLNCGPRRYFSDIKITCLPDGTWSEPETSCDTLVDTKPTCPPLGSISNGILVMIADSPTLLMYEYRCQDGFSLVGNASLVCQDDGTWSHEIPSCSGQMLREPTVLCPKPATIENGSFLLSQDPATPGAHVLYKCNVGYLLEGSSILTCLPSGSWSNSYPHCQKENISTCTELTVINADVLYLDQGKAPGQRAIVQCRKGYVLRGEPLLWCQQSGSWNATPPYCDVLTPFVLNGAPKDAVADTQSDTGKSGNITESTWAILVTGLVGAALFVAVIGFGAAFVISKWRRHSPKPENQVITYQIGQQLSGDQFQAQLMGGSPSPNSPQMPILYAINNAGNVPAHANFHFATGFASYQLEPVGSFTYHSSMVRPTKLSVQRRKSVGSSSELSAVSSKIESRRSSEPAPAVARISPISVEQQSNSSNTVQVVAAVEQNADNEKFCNEETNSYEAFNNNSEYDKDENDSIWNPSVKSTNATCVEYEDNNNLFLNMTVDTSVTKSVSATHITETQTPSPPISPLVIRSGYSSPREKLNTPTQLPSISTSPEESPKFSVHISATTKNNLLRNSAGLNNVSQNNAGLDNPAFALEEIVVNNTLQMSDSRRNSSSSSYLGGSSSDGSNPDHHNCQASIATVQKPVLASEPPQVPLKRKSSWSVKDLQAEIRSLPLFQRLRKSLGDDGQNSLNASNESLQQRSNKPVSAPKPSSPKRDPASLLPPVPVTMQRLTGRKESSDNDTSTPLALLDNQFADNGPFFEETSSDEIMYEQVAQVESPEHHCTNIYNTNTSNTNDSSHVNVQINGSIIDSSENSSLDSQVDVMNSSPAQYNNQTNPMQYYGPTAQLSDSSLNTSDDQNNPLDFASNQIAEESSGNEQQVAPYHQRLRRIYTQPNQRNFNYDREIHSENERYGKKQLFQTGHIYPKRSPPIMGTKGLRRIPVTALDNTSGSRSEGELDPKPRMFYTERFPPIAAVAPTHRAPTQKGQNQKRGQSPRKYPNSPRLGRNKLQTRATNELRLQRSLTDSEEEISMKPSKLIGTPIRSSIMGNKRHPEQGEMVQDKDRKRVKVRVPDNFEAYLPNDEALLSEKFELDQNFLEPVELRHSGYHRSQSGYPLHVQRSRVSQSQRALTLDAKLVSKPKPHPRQNHGLHQSVQTNPPSQSKEAEFRRKPNLVPPNNSKTGKPPMETSNNTPSVSWDAKKFKHRHKRVQFKDDIDEIISHSPEPTSDDETASHVQLPAYQYWRQNLRPAAGNPGAGQRYGVNILSD